MQSIFLLCEKEIPYNTVMTLYNNDITIQSIIDNPYCLYEVLGLKSKKADNVLEKIPIIMNEGKTNSIYDLTIYGLSKTIVDKLFLNDINIQDIDDRLFKNKIVTNSTYNKIINSYKKFIIDNDIELEINSEKLLNIIKNEYVYEKFSLTDLKQKLSQLHYTTSNINELLFELLTDKQIKNTDNLFFITKPKLLEELSKISNVKNKYDIVMKKLSGKTLESIGQEYNLTRERIRQIISKELRKITLTEEEELYKDIFQTYNFSASLFCEIFEEELIVYYFLKEKYKIGSKEPCDLLDDISLNNRQLNILKRYYNLIEYNGETIVARRPDIFVAILKKSQDIVNTDFIAKEYNNILQVYDLNLPQINSSDYRNVDAVLTRNNKVISSIGKQYRYYDLSELDEESVFKLQNMLDVEAGVYSAGFFFNNYQNLMKNIDIRNEYELHNLLRKIIGKNSNRIKFSRMPDIFIDCEDKIKFIKSLIEELSPINLDEFIEYVYQNYGHKTNTFKALLSTSFSHHIQNGFLVSEYEKITIEQEEILKKLLTEDIYSINTIKQILTDIFDVNNFKLINNVNMKKLGYRLRGNYIMKDSISSLDSYLREIILTNEYFEPSDEIKKIGSTFSSYMYKFINEFEIFEIKENKYITRNKLEKLGLKKTDIQSFLQKINENIKDNEYFNLFSLSKNNFLSNFKEIELPTIFYESIISIMPNVKTLRIKNNVLFIKTDKQVTREHFINSFVNGKKIYIKEIQKYIIDKFNFELEEFYIKEFINKKKYYLDSSIDCVYISKEEYEQDINSIEILQYLE